MADDVTWKVISQRQTTAPDAVGRYVPVVAVTYQLSTGTARTINVPVDGYTAEAVRAAITADAAHTAAVDQLEG